MHCHPNATLTPRGRAKVFEARRHRGKIEGRYLEGEEASTILADVGTVWSEHDSFASFAWSESLIAKAASIFPT